MSGVVLLSTVGLFVSGTDESTTVVAVPASSSSTTVAVAQPPAAPTTTASSPSTPNPKPSFVVIPASHAALFGREEQSSPSWAPRSQNERDPRPPQKARVSFVSPLGQVFVVTRRAEVVVPAPDENFPTYTVT